MLLFLQRTCRSYLFFKGHSTSIFFLNFYHESGQTGNLDFIKKIKNKFWHVEKWEVTIFRSYMSLFMSLPTVKKQFEHLPENNYDSNIRTFAQIYTLWTYNRRQNDRNFRVCWHNRKFKLERTKTREFPYDSHDTTFQRHYDFIASLLPWGKTIEFSLSGLLLSQWRI